MVDAMLVVIGAIIALGALPCFPQTNELTSKITDGWSQTRRTLLGLNIILLAGIMASTWTMIIKRDLVATGASGSCTAAGCSALIGSHEWNTMPVIGLDWGLVGFIAFAALGFLALSLFYEAGEGWVRRYVDMGFYASAAGLPFVAWLVAIELFLADGAPVICPFCTMAHIATVLSFVIFLALRRKHDAGEWAN